jgi:hypothetical protein
MAARGERKRKKEREREREREKGLRYWGVQYLLAGDHAFNT